MIQNWQQNSPLSGDRAPYNNNVPVNNRKKRDVEMIILGLLSTIFFLLLYSRFGPHQKNNEISFCQPRVSIENDLYSAVLVSHRLKTEKIYIEQLRKYYEAVYKINQYEQKQFCVIIPTYNNVADNRYLTNLKSIISQEYNNYNVILIDDKSSDGTPEKLQNYISGLPEQIKSKINLKKNLERKKALYNIYWAAHNFCSEDSIITIVDGDDFLINDFVFKLFNALYHIHGSWFIYSNFITNLNNLGYSYEYPEIIRKSRSFRKSFNSFPMSHQHTFYTKLFRKIKEEDLKDEQGKWFQVTYDLAIYFPMAQMAGDRMKFIAEPTYYYVTDTGLNDFSVNMAQQLKNQFTIRQKQPYNLQETL